MTDCKQETFEFPSLKGRKVVSEFTGGDVTSDGGALLLRAIDQKLKLTEKLLKKIPDRRNPVYITHTLESLLKQRIYGIALGYEDLNDHTTLRNDAGFQTAVNCDDLLASSSTLCRLENRSSRQIGIDINKIFVETFIESFDSSPNELILDFDPTDDLVYGNQAGRFFHGYYGDYCFLPLYVFCGEQLLVSYLRPSNIDGAKHAWAILALLVKRFRKAWPKVKIIFRGDSGFCRDKMLSWCDRYQVNYITGITKNDRLLACAKSICSEAKIRHEETSEKQRLFGDFIYSAKSWKEERRIIVKAEHTSKGENPRFIVTNLVGDAQFLYEKIYCARGDMENRIKEQQLDLFADRTSCQHWWANQFRLLLSSCAYILVSGIRRIALRNTELEKAQSGTIRLKLFKIGAVIIRNTRRVRFLLSSSYPYQTLFLEVAAKLVPG
jgi:Transposase DDE domain group 1